MRPIIGIVARPDINEQNKTVMTVMDNYRNAIIKAGGIPIVILPPQPIFYKNTPSREINLLSKQEKEIIKKQLDLVQGILMPGGSRIFEYDKYICMLSQNKPLLGICMGMQVMCNFDNDNVNILNDDDEHKQIDVDYVHEVTIDKSSYLYSIIKEETFKVNSLHNYHVSNSGSYDTIGYSHDGLIEAIEKKDKPFNIGVQWHPEKNYDTDIVSKRLFKKFIEEAKKVGF